jgi:NTF2 fold immunity protein
MITKNLVLFLTAALLLANPSASTYGATDRGYEPPDGFVPDAETAAKISEIVLVRVYGETQTNLEKPLKATLHGDVWIVQGTMPPTMLGGVAEVHISKKDGRILYLTHGR